MSQHETGQLASEEGFYKRQADAIDRAFSKKVCEEHHIQCPPEINLIRSIMHYAVRKNGINAGDGVRRYFLPYDRNNLGWIHESLASVKCEMVCVTDTSIEFCTSVNGGAVSMLKYGN